MGLRFQSLVKLLPAVHLDLSCSGVGVSVGGRAASIAPTPAMLFAKLSIACWTSGATDVISFDPATLMDTGGTI